MIFCHNTLLNLRQEYYKQISKQKYRTNHAKWSKKDVLSNWTQIASQAFFFHVLEISKHLIRYSWGVSPDDSSELKDNNLLVKQTGDV